MRLEKKQHQINNNINNLLLTNQAPFLTLTKSVKDLGNFK